MRKWFWFFLLIPVFLSIPIVSISAQQDAIPAWLKETAIWWGEGKIGDDEFINALQWLLDNEILVIGEKEDAIIDSNLNFDKIAFEVTGIEELIRNVPMRQILSDSNDDFSNTADVFLQIEKRDQEWTAAGLGQLTPLMVEILENDLSEKLRNHADLYGDSVGYDVYPEIFVTNAYGVNVAMTGQTSDYKQNDEVWWIRAKEQGLYLSESHYDQSAGVTSVDIAIRVSDNQGGFLGVVKAVTNVEGSFP